MNLEPTKWEREKNEYLCETFNSTRKINRIDQKNPFGPRKYFGPDQVVHVYPQFNSLEICVAPIETWALGIGLLGFEIPLQMVSFFV